MDATIEVPGTSRGEELKTDVPPSTERPRRWGGWILALAGASVPLLPVIGFLWLAPWTFDPDSAWAWLVIFPLPLAGLSLLWLPRRWLTGATRLVCGGAVLHAGIMMAVAPAWRWPSIATAWLSIDFLLFAATLLPAIGLGPAGRLAKATLILTGCFFGVGMPLALLNAAIVCVRAEKIAGEDPYCIQYASQTYSFAYEPALTLLDLSALKMQARLWEGGSTVSLPSYHALLVVDHGARKVMNWSYVKEDFDASAVEYLRVEPSIIYCRPEPHYALHLPFWSADLEHEIRISVAGRTFLIPQKYRPRVVKDSLVFNAIPANLERAQGRRFPFYLAEPNIRIAVNPNYDIERSYNWHISPSTPIMERTVEFGLDKMTIANYLPRGRKSPGLTIYTGKDDSGELVRSLVCFLREIPTYCIDNFKADGLVYHAFISDPSQWKPIEQRLNGLVSSFEIGVGSQR